ARSCSRRDPLEATAVPEAAGGSSTCGARLRGRASGIVASAPAARAYIATPQPRLEMKSWLIGASRNCPRLPPALMTPEAKARFSGERRRAVAPVRIEKLPAAAPA